MVESDWNLSYMTFQTNHLIKCSLHHQKWSFYINAGPHLYYRKIEKNKTIKTIIIEHDNGTLIQDYEDALFKNLKVAGINFVSGLGISYWQFSLEGRVETNTYLNKSQGNQVQESCMYILLRYTF